nr:MFS transporter [Saccharopolyspora sp. HNM0983]
MLSPQHRAFTAGLALVITLIAFEAMGVATALPAIVADLRAPEWYSWPLTVFLAASALGTAFGGRYADRRGPGGLLLLGLAAFAAGLLLAAHAPDMPVLLAGRAVQGAGGGVVLVSLYVMIAGVFPQRQRPAAFGVVSAAWVLPALVGPAVAGLLTEHASWRWVFGGLAPFVLVGGLLVLPAARRFGRPAAESSGQPAAGGAAAIGAAAGVIGLNWAAQRVVPEPLVAAPVGIAALVLLIGSLRSLLPAGTLTGRPGIPLMVLARGLLAGVFFAAQAFVPLALVAAHGYPPSAAGVPLTVGSLGWSVGAFWQARRRHLRRERVVAVGFLLVAAGVAGLACGLSAALPAWTVFVCWPLAGAGMGIGIASTSVRVLELSPEGRRGFHSSALQMCDMLGQAAFVGAGGVLVAALAGPGAPARGVPVLDLLLVPVAVLTAAALLRSDLGRTS